MALPLSVRSAPAEWRWSQPIHPPVGQAPEVRVAFTSEQEDELWARGGKES